jgi:hypothetical protein
MAVDSRLIRLSPGARSAAISCVTSPLTSNPEPTPGDESVGTPDNGDPTPGDESVAIPDR